MAKVSVDDFVESLGSWTVLDLVNAKKKIEETYGITAAAPVAAVAVAAPRLARRRSRSRPSSRSS